MSTDSRLAAGASTVNDGKFKGASLELTSLDFPCKVAEFAMSTRSKVRCLEVEILSGNGL